MKKKRAAFDTHHAVLLYRVSIFDALVGREAVIVEDLHLLEDGRFARLARTCGETKAIIEWIAHNTRSGRKGGVIRFSKICYKSILERPLRRRR